MTLEIYPWEYPLLAKAQEAMQSRYDRTNFFAERGDEELLDKAFRYSSQITKQYSQTFYLATSLLPAEKRKAMRALYAFCRLTDNLVDGNPDSSQAALEDWRSRSLHQSPSKDDLVAYAWTETRTKFNIPRQLGDQLIDGVAQDLTKKRYQSFDELASYCYAVASTVGLMAMHIIGFQSPEAIPYAIKLGVALQLTNILRDVGEDWRAGRIYLPMDELAQFGLSEADIASNNNHEYWLSFLDFQIVRNQQLYRDAKPGICMLNKDGRFAVLAAAELYQGILNVIKINRGDVFNLRAVVSPLGKFRRLPSIWRQSLTCT